MTMKRVVNRNDKYDLINVEPKYGINYNRGYIGFCYSPESLISKIIAKTTKYCNYSGISVSHALIVYDENYCIETHPTLTKVSKQPLSKYFDDPKMVISFRKPRELTPEIADEIAQLAESKIGCKYEYAELLGHLGKSLPGINQFNKITHNIIVDIIGLLIDNKDKFICSELCAYALKYAHSWKYRNKGILSRFTTRVNPQELFEDREIFSDWTLDRIVSNSTSNINQSVNC